MFAYIVFYLSLCCIVALMGRTQPIGFLGYLILSLLLSPLIGAAILIILAFHTRAHLRKIEAKKAPKDVAQDTKEAQQQ